jgi:hypothetical protein
MKYSFFFSLLVVCYSGYGQCHLSDSLPLAKVKNWSKKSYYVTKDFWTSVQEEMIKKVGEPCFEQIKKFSANSNIPNALLQWAENRQPAKISLEEYAKRLNSLKIYKLVTVDHYWKDQYWGKYAILAIPHQKTSWDTTAKWDMVYFIIKTEAIEEQ